MASTGERSSSLDFHSRVEKNLGPPASLAQLIQAAIAGHLKQPALERDIPQQDRQGNIELEEDMLEHVVDLPVVFEYAPDVVH